MWAPGESMGRRRQRYLCLCCGGDPFWEGVEVREVVSIAVGRCWLPWNRELWVPREEISWRIRKRNPIGERNFLARIFSRSILFHSCKRQTSFLAPTTKNRQDASEKAMIIMTRALLGLSVPSTPVSSSIHGIATNSSLRYAQALVASQLSLL